MHSLNQNAYTGALSSICTRQLPEGTHPPPAQPSSIRHGSRFLSGGGGRGGARKARHPRSVRQVTGEMAHKRRKPKYFCAATRIDTSSLADPKHGMIKGASPQSLRKHTTPLAEDAPQRLPAFRNALRGSGDKHAAAEGGKTALYPRLQWEYLERKREVGEEVLHSEKGMHYGSVNSPEEKL
ncbi:hypothetical protein E1301_Tti011558 [Triplophysa tibetana]|uniref:Uncharacterized protein n=1 Tax=Triplophysa tibetana TaxID=1572043 RepID=A0A5A9PI57_9TELE|nr:hypothetical protein E1301_Tti011558 [Triplophysa tibetana]